MKINQFPFVSLSVFANFCTEADDTTLLPLIKRPNSFYANECSWGTSKNWQPQRPKLPTVATSWHNRRGNDSFPHGTGGKQNCLNRSRSMKLSKWIALTSGLLTWSNSHRYPYVTGNSQIHEHTAEGVPNSVIMVQFLFRLVVKQSVKRLVNGNGSPQFAL